MSRNQDKLIKMTNHIKNFSYISFYIKNIVKTFSDDVFDIKQNIRKVFYMICHFDQSILISWQWLVYSDYRFYYLYWSYQLVQSLSIKVRYYDRKVRESLGIDMVVVRYGQGKVLDKNNVKFAKTNKWELLFRKMKALHWNLT